MNYPRAIALDGVASGIWKFNLPKEDVINIACELRANDESHNYIDMMVRGCGRSRKTKQEQYGIEISYCHDSESEKEYTLWFHCMKRKLKKLSGNKLCGWDICSSSVSIT